jgi:protein subunit release factor A
MDKPDSKSGHVGSNPTSLANPSAIAYKLTHWLPRKTTKMKRILEIRSGEGGNDAKLFVAELALGYLKLAERKT